MGEREEAVERLLAGYRRYYTITRFDGGKHGIPGGRPYGAALLFREGPARCGL